MLAKLAITFSPWLSSSSFTWFWPAATRQHPLIVMGRKCFLCWERWQFPSNWEAFPKKCQFCFYFHLSERNSADLKNCSVNCAPHQTLPISRNLKPFDTRCTHKSTEWLSNMNTQNIRHEYSSVEHSSKKAMCFQKITYHFERPHSIYFPTKVLVFWYTLA